MKRLLLSAMTIILLAAIMLVGCADDNCEEPAPNMQESYAETLTQVSTVDALLNGIYDGKMTYGELGKYGDFGLGTFEALDGEMLAFDGDFYQVKADGVAYEVDDSMTTPFAQVAFFDPDHTIQLADDITYENLDETIDGELPTENIFYAIRIEGTFDYIKTRSVPGQTKPYPPLVEVTAHQPTFEFHDVDGTVVGFRSPPYMDGVGVPGYHLHFLTKDRKAGGHILEIDVKQAAANIDYISEFCLMLPGNSAFYKLDLSKDKAEELKKAESSKSPEQTPVQVDSGTQASEKVSYLFVQEAAGGTLDASSDGTYTLQMNGVFPYTVYFSDRPQTIAGSVPMQTFIDGFAWDAGDPPNASIVVADADESEDILIARLTSPVYDSTAMTLSYGVQPLEDYQGDGLAYYHSGSDESIPESFGAVSLYIDDCSDHYGDCWIVPDSPSGGCEGEQKVGSMRYGRCYHFPSCKPCHSQDTYRRECADKYGPNSDYLGCNATWRYSFRDGGSEISN